MRGFKIELRHRVLVAAEGAVLVLVGQRADLKHEVFELGRREVRLIGRKKVKEGHRLD